LQTVKTARTGHRKRKFILKLLVSLILVCSVISGCLYLPKCKEECEPAPESFAEMALLGVSITTDQGPFPNNANRKIHYGEEPYLGSNRLVILFSPAPEFLTNYDFSHVGERVNGSPYAYFYSQQQEAEFLRIQPASRESEITYEFSYQSDLDYVPADADYYGGDGADYILTTRVLSIPARATHIELWHRAALDAEQSLVRRVPLASLYAWRTYFQPLIDETL